MEYSQFLATAAGAFLIWETMLLIPMVPGKLVDTRDFSPLPRWQFRLFNVFLTSLGLVSFVVAWFVLEGHAWAFVATLVLAILYAAVFFSDLMKIFPVVPDALPVQLLILEAISLASACVGIVIAIQGIRM